MGNSHMDVKTKKFTVGTNGDQIKVLVESNTDFEYSVPKEYIKWIVPPTSDKIKGDNNLRTLVFTVCSNSANSRTGKILFRLKGQTAYSDTVTVDQNYNSNCSIDLKVPGTLATYINNQYKYQIQNLVVTGNINSDDIRLIRDMAGVDQKGEATQGNIKSVDLSKAAIVEGGDPYYTDERGKSYSTVANTISDFMFAKTNLTLLNLPTNLTAIGNNAFQDCSSLSYLKLPASISSIGTYAFENCVTLAYINIPANVTEIKDYTFHNCKALSNCKLDGDNLKTIGKHVFESCRSITDFQITSKVETIGDYAFHECNGLTSVTIPENVKTIGKDVYKDCIALTTASVSGTQTVGVSMFENCVSLKDVTLADNITGIDGDAFEKCTNLEAIKLPKALKNIETYAFLQTNLNIVDCTALTEVPHLEGNAFARATSGERVLVSNQDMLNKFVADPTWAQFFSKNNFMIQK